MGVDTVWQSHMQEESLIRELANLFQLWDRGRISNQRLLDQVQAKFVLQSELHKGYSQTRGLLDILQVQQSEQELR